MAQLLSNTYDVIGLNSTDDIEELANRLDAAPGVVGVTVDFEKKEAEITSYEKIDITILEEALTETEWYITVQTDNNWVPAPSFRKVAANVRQKHNAAKNIEGANPGGYAADTGPRVDYDKD